MDTDENRAEQLARGGSTESEWVPENEAIPFVRWSARALGVIIAGFSLFMFIGETFERHTPSRPLEPIKPIAVVGFILAGAYVAGMFLALKWERAGAKLSGASLGLILIALFISGRARIPSVDDPTLAALWSSIVGLVFFLPVMLYGLCWWLEDRDRKRYRAGSSTAPES